MTIYFEDIKLGFEIYSAGRTISEADIVNFAGISADFNPLHTNELWVKENTSFPSRIAHGLLVQSIGEGLACADINSWQILAFLEVNRQMIFPVFPGDTICQKYTVEEKRLSNKNNKQGLVKVAIEIINQDNEIVQKGYNIYMIGAGKYDET